MDSNNLNPWVIQTLVPWKWLSLSFFDWALLKDKVRRLHCWNEKILCWSSLCKNCNDSHTTLNVGIGKSTFEQRTWCYLLIRRIQSQTRTCKSKWIRLACLGRTSCWDIEIQRAVWLDLSFDRKRLSFQICFKGLVLDFERERKLGKWSVHSGLNSILQSYQQYGARVLKEFLKWWRDVQSICKLLKESLFPMDNVTLVLWHSSLWNTCLILVIDWNEWNVPCFKLIQVRGYWLYKWSSIKRNSQQYKSTFKSSKRMIAFKMWVYFHLERYSWFKIFTTYLCHKWQKDTQVHWYRLEQALNCKIGLIIESSLNRSLTFMQRSRFHRWEPKLKTFNYWEIHSNLRED